MDTILHFRRKDFPLNEACFLELLQMLGYGRFRNGQHLMDIAEETLIPLGQKTQNGDPGRMPHRFGKTCQLLLCTGIALFFHYKTAHIVRKYTNNIEITNPSLPEKHIRFIYPANKKRQKPDPRFIPRRQSQFPRQTKKTETRSAFHTPQAKSIPPANKKKTEIRSALHTPQAKSIPPANKKRQEPDSFGFLSLSHLLSCPLERKTGFGPATPTLARWCSTTELFPQCVSKKLRRAENGIRTRDPHLGKVVLYH